jgi:hypothetical protein
VNWLRHFFPAEVLCFFLLLVLVLIGFRSRAFFDPGAFWHIRVGEVLLRDGFIEKDPFTWTKPNDYWIPQQWLSEMGMAKIHAWFGFDGMLLLLATILAAYGTWMIHRFLKMGCHPFLATAITFFFATGALFHVAARPHTLTILFMGLLMSWLIDFEAKRTSMQGFAIRFIPLMWLWSNLHGGAIGGYFTAGIAWFAWWTGSWRSKSSPFASSIEAAKCLAILAVGFVISFLNPYGWHLHEMWIRIVGSKAPRELINEHMPANLHEPITWLLISILIVYYAIIRSTPIRPMKDSWILPLIWFGACLSSIRHAPLFAITALTVVSDMLHQSSWFAKLKSNGDFLIREPQPGSGNLNMNALPTIVVTLGLILTYQSDRPAIDRPHWAQPAGKISPLELVPIIQEYANTHPNGTRIYNDANLGGFVIYHFPNFKTFMDDRFELFGPDWCRHYVYWTEQEPEKILEVIREGKIERLLVQTETGLDAYLHKESGRFRELARTPDAAWYEVINRRD